MKRFYLGVFVAIACNASNALEVATGRVTYLEPTYLPAVVSFAMDSGSASCPAGQLLKWQKADQSNNKAAYATLMLALSTGKKIRLFFNDGDTTCIGQYLHLLSD